MKSLSKLESQENRHVRDATARHETKKKRNASQAHKIQHYTAKDGSSDGKQTTATLSKRDSVASTVRYHPIFDSLKRLDPVVRRNQ